MVDPIIAFFAGFLLTWPALIILLFLGIIFEHNDARGMAVFTALVSAAVAYFFFAIPFWTLMIYAGIYLVAGICWSMWRYKRALNKMVEENRGETETNKERALRRLHPRHMWPTIIAWVFVWPFSFVENIVGDVITTVSTAIKKVFHDAYQRMFDHAVSQLK